MGTVIKAETSKKSTYWIDKHRYYELKHFCMQYSLWKKEYSELICCKFSDILSPSDNKTSADPTLNAVEKRLFYRQRMDMIEKIATQTDESLSNYILKAVTEGVSYVYLKARLDIPCSRSTYYELYRKFFWLLDKERR